MRNSSLEVLYPVKLLLIQTLSSGNISSLDDALTQASLRLDRTERPVIPQLIKSSASIAWDVPAGTGQVNKTTNDLGLVAGILAGLLSHDVRRGAFRDLAILKSPSNLLVGVATKKVTRVARHSSGSYLRSTMDRYVGEVEQDK